MLQDERGDVRREYVREENLYVTALKKPYTYIFVNARIKTSITLVI